MERQGPIVHVDCPACGAAAETMQAVLRLGSGEVTCRLCAFELAAPGVVIDRGHDVHRDDIGDGAWWWAPDPVPYARYRAPSERRWALRLVQVGTPDDEPGPPLIALPSLAVDPSLASITIRLNRRPGRSR